jgi:hypothetical protein
MLSKTIDLSVSKGEFLFTDGFTVCRFRPIIFITAEKKILSIGDPPATPFEARRIDVFEDVDTDAMELLESLLRYGMSGNLKGSGR